MIAKPPHNRKLGLLGVSLTNARLNKQSGPALDFVRNELEPVLVKSGYLDNAPFSWVTVSLRYGLKNEDEPHYQKINKKYGDLPLAIEVDTHELLGATLEKLTDIFRVAVLKALIAAGQKYRRPVEELKTMLNRIEL